MSDDIQKARRMTIRLFGLGERMGSPLSGELAQLLASNAFFQNDKVSNLVKLTLETSDGAPSAAPLNKAFRLFYAAREDFPRPFQSRGDCLQSCIYDSLLCYMSFWGQVFEYYETMYYKPVELPDGSIENSPATVSFEIGWQITCLFIRDMMLSAAARAAGVPSGYNMTLNWFFFPANASSELEEAKSLVLTVIGQIRKRGTVLVSKEGMNGHISFSNTIPLLHWIEDKLNKDWNNKDRLDCLCVEYFESTSIRLNVSVNPINDSNSNADEALNASFGPDTSFLDGLEGTPSSDMQSSISVSSSSIALNIRPITPAILASETCEWSGVDMGEFCRDIAENCTWPEVVNTLTTAGDVGFSILNMCGEVLVSSCRSGRRRSSLSAPSRLSMTPEQDAILPFPTPHEMPHLEPVGMPKFGMEERFGQIPIPEFTPTPNRGKITIPELTPTPKPRSNRDSDVTFFGDDTSPLDPVSDRPLVPLDPVEESPNKLQRVLSRPSVVASSPLPTSSAIKTSASLSQVVDFIVTAARRELAVKDWSLESALGDLVKKGKTLGSLYMYISSANPGESTLGADQNDQTNNGRKRRRSSLSKSAELPRLSESILMEAEKQLITLFEIVERHALRVISSDQRTLFRTLTRVLVLAHLWCNPDENVLKQAIAVSGDFVCFCYGLSPFIAPTDVWAAGLRGAYADLNVGMIELALDLNFRDWMSLALFYNDFAYAVLMGETGLFTPNVTQSAPVRRGPQKLVKPTLREALRQHCVMVCSELVNRWSFHLGSSFWRIYDTLEQDYLSRRHFVEQSLIEDRDMDRHIDRMDRFLHICLVDASTFLIDLGDRVGVSSMVLHAAFDIVRSVVLLRPLMLKGRHMHQIAMCALQAASTLFSAPQKRLDFSKITEGVLLMHPGEDVKLIVSRFLLRTVLMSLAGGQTLFGECSAALAVPTCHQPDSELTGNIHSFYEKVFVGEMRQVLFNLSRARLHKDTAGIGPYCDKYPKDSCMSPLSFVALSSALVIGMQTAFGISNAEHQTVSKDKFRKALELTCPMGVVPCLVPPTETGKEKPMNKKDRVFRWFSRTSIWANDNGNYSVIEDNQ